MEEEEGLLSVQGEIPGTSESSSKATEPITTAEKILKNCIVESTNSLLCKSAEGAAESFMMLVGEAVVLPSDNNKIKDAVNPK